MIGNAANLKRPARLLASHMDCAPHVAVHTSKWFRNGKGRCYDEAHRIPEDKRGWQGRGGVGWIRIWVPEARKVIVCLPLAVTIEGPGLRERGARAGVLTQGRRDGDPIEGPRERGDVCGRGRVGCRGGGCLVDLRLRE